MVKEHLTNFDGGAGRVLGDDLHAEIKAARAERRRRPKSARRQNEVTFGLEQPDAQQNVTNEYGSLNSVLEVSL